MASGSCSLSNFTKIGFNGNYYVNVNSNNGTATAYLKFTNTDKPSSSRCYYTNINISGSYYVRNSSGNTGSSANKQRVRVTITPGYWSIYDSNTFIPFYNCSYTTTDKWWDADPLTFNETFTDVKREVATNYTSNLPAWEVSSLGVKLDYVGSKGIFSAETLRAYFSSFTFTYYRTSKCGVDFYSSTGVRLDNAQHEFDSNSNLNTYLTDRGLTSNDFIDNNEYFIEWKVTSGGQDNFYSYGNLPLTGEQDLYCYAITGSYYNANYYDGDTLLKTDVNGVRSTYNYNLLDDTSIQQNGMQSRKKTHKFLGWSTSSNTSEVQYQFGDSVSKPFLSNLNFYAVWQKRDSITIVSSPSGVINSDDIHFINTPNASDGLGLTYYFDVETNISRQCTVSIGTTSTRDQYKYYIDSVVGVEDGIINSNGQRSWTGNNVTNNSTTATATTITVNLKRNLYFNLYAYALEKDPNEITGPNPSNWNSDISINIDDSTRYVFTSSQTGSTSYNCKYTEIRLNPGDSITFTVTCNNPDYYLARIHTPNTTSSMSGQWAGTYSGSTKAILNTETINRNTLKVSGGYNGNRVSTSIIDTNCRNCTYTITIPTGNDGISLMGTDSSTYRYQRAYLAYEPFHCQVQLTNTDYTPSISRSVDLTDAECLFVDTTPQIYRFFNDIELTEENFIYCKRSNNTTNDIIATVSYNDNVYSIEYPSLWFGSNKIHNLYYFPLAQKQTIGESDYYTDHFSELRIQPDQSLLDEYHTPYTLNVTWSNTLYRCFIILRLPEAGEDANTAETDSSNISSKISCDFSGWVNINKSGQNRLVYYKDFNTSIGSINNIEISDVSNSGYILKNIQRYHYNSAYTSVINKTTNPPIIVTREELDSETKNLSTVLPGWNRSSSATSNDVLTFNQNTLPAGAVDYYFITYEEGLPIFYPDSENNPKRAIQLYWEGNRAIGLYYENTRLL